MTSFFDVLTQKINQLFKPKVYEINSEEAIAQDALQQNPNAGAARETPSQFISPLSVEEEFKRQQMGSQFISPQGSPVPTSKPTPKSTPQIKFNPHTPDWVKPLAQKAGEKYGVPTELLTGQMLQESSFRPDATSPAGARGISQFMEATARAYGLRVDNQVDERLIPEKAIEAQARMMSDLYQKYGSWERALSAYNSGKPDAYKDPQFAGGETYNYVRKIYGQH